MAGSVDKVAEGHGPGTGTAGAAGAAGATTSGVFPLDPDAPEPVTASHLDAPEPIDPPAPLHDSGFDSAAADLPVPTWR